MKTEHQPAAKCAAAQEMARRSWANGPSEARRRASRENGRKGLGKKRGKRHADGSDETTAVNLPSPAL